MKSKASLFTVLLLLLLSVGAYAQRAVSGVVKAAGTGEPLPAVAVKEKGTNNAVVTNFDGKFTITVTSANPVLVFSSMGVQPKEVSVGTSDFLVVNMEMESNDLDEVVVTALGVSKEKRSLGYAVTNLGNDEIKNSGEQNVIQSLSAKAPGVQVIGSGGTPGASSKITIRGNATFTGNNQPLIVVDGVPIDNSTTQTTAGDYPFNQNLSGVNNSNRAIDINPDDIESVTVLKGPAAAALYGARAGNGAIIYTTKRGKVGAKGLGVKVSSSVEISQVNKLPKLQDRWAAGNGGVYTPPADPGPDGLFDTNDDVAFGTPNSWGPRVDTTNLPTYDNLGNFFQTGYSYNNGIEVTGGSENASVRLSLSNLRQSGVVPNTEFDRTSVRLTGDVNLSRRVKVGGTANYVRSSSVMAQNGSNLSGIMLTLLRAPITYDLDNYQYANGYNRSYFYIYDNPYYTAYENPFTSNVNRILGNIYMNYLISDHWDMSYKIGVDAYSDNRKQIYAVSAWGDDIGSVGQVNENRLVSSQLYGDLLVNYHTELDENSKLKVTAGHNFFVNEFNDAFSRGRILSIPNFYNLANASDLYASQAQSKVKSAAFFGDIAYEYKNWLYLNATGRNEWSSTFEVDEKNNFFYPSANAAVVFSEFFDESLKEYVNFGKVRYSYAQVGIAPSPYTTRTYYTSPTYTDGFTNGLSFPYIGQNGYAISNTLGNRGLKPERVIGNEFGVALGLFNGFMDLDVTYYNQKTVDILLFKPTPGSSGFTSNYTNSGEMVNRGVEVMANFHVLREGNLKWDIGANWYANRSEVLKLADGVDEVSIEAAFASIGSFAIVGQPYGAFYGTRWARNDQGQILIGANGRPVLDGTTGNIGNPQPDWMAGLRNTFTYKNLTFSFLFDFRKGGSIWNGTYARLNNVGRSGDSDDRERTYVVEGVYAPGTVIGGVDVSGQTNTTEISANAYYRQVVGDAGGAAEEFVEEVNWVRLRDVNLSYRFDFREKNYGIEYLNLSFTGRNLFLSTNYKGVDPETSLTGAGSNLNGFDYFNNPGTRSYLFGLSFGF